MKPHTLSFAVLVALLSVAGAAQADSDGPQFVVSQRLWQADWDVGFSNPRIIQPSAAQPMPGMSTRTDFVKVRRTVPLTGFGVSLDRWTLSATIGWPTDYADPLIDGKASRSEYDINLGYAVTPNINAVLLYKAGKSDIPAAAGNPAPGLIREQQKLRGAGLGVSARYPIAENWSLYGSTAYSTGHSRFQVTRERYSARYTIADAGVAYRMPGTFGNMSITAGYRYQNLDFRHAYVRTYVVTPEPVLIASEPTRIQSATKGFTAGVAYNF